ncbi:Beta-glucosidase [Rhodospirillaceae bacterium LM-1]|nr:Beta-glucosidase [Rhodospirillaceae bacterium LM-1]
MKQSRFPNLSSLPPSFLFGASTSCYQVEGALNEDGRGRSFWETYAAIPGKIANGDTAEVACDHYHRSAQDVALMQDLGLTAYRFSVSWARILPQGQGAVNEAGLDFYDRLIDQLLAAKIKPFLCLYHWDLPQALDDLGGWLNRDIANWFADYARIVANRLGNRVSHFATFNEPSLFTLFGYGWNWMPPGKADRKALLTSIHNVNLSHGAGVDAVKSEAPQAQLGCVHTFQPCFPETDDDNSRAASSRMDEMWNRSFPHPQILGRYPDGLAEEMEAVCVRPGDLARIQRPLDWFGLNHYSPSFVKEDDNVGCFGFGAAPPELGQTGIGWAISPEVFRDALHDISSTYGLPIYVTENGFGTRSEPEDAQFIQDQDRIDYLNSYIAAMTDAVAKGVDVRGYFVWSLMDNFEWVLGYEVRFGIVHVDYKTQTRTPKASANWYKDLIAGFKLGQADRASEGTIKKS